MGSGSSLIHWGNYSTDEGLLPLDQRLTALHELNLAVTTHHLTALSDIDFESISKQDIHSLLKAYAAHHAMHSQENDGAVSPRVGRELLAVKARQMAKYFNALASELEPASSSISSFQLIRSPQLSQRPPVVEEFVPNSNEKEEFISNSNENEESLEK